MIEKIGGGGGTRTRGPLLAKHETPLQRDDTQALFSQLVDATCEARRGSDRVGFCEDQKQDNLLPCWRQSKSNRSPVINTTSP
jgi:hypothetical protein